VIAEATRVLFYGSSKARVKLSRMANEFSYDKFVNDNKEGKEENVEQSYKLKTIVKIRIESQ